jgi:spore coat protein U-like protein
MKLITASALTAALALNIGTPAMAAVSTSNLSISATVLDLCKVTADSVAFGNLSNTSSTNEASAGNIEVICTSAKSSVTVTLGSGENADGTQRQMVSSGGDTVPYALHSDSAHSNAVAVDGAIYTGAVAVATPKNIAVYGQVPAGDYVAGSYTDTVLVTLTY